MSIHINLPITNIIFKDVDSYPEDIAFKLVGILFLVYLYYISKSLWATDHHTHMCFVNIPLQIHAIPVPPKGVQLGYGQGFGFFTLVSQCLYGRCFVHKGIVMLEQV